MHPNAISFFKEVEARENMLREQRTEEEAVRKARYLQEALAWMPGQREYLVRTFADFAVRGEPDSKEFPLFELADREPSEAERAKIEAFDDHFGVRLMDVAKIELIENCVRPDGLRYEVTISYGGLKVMLQESTYKPSYEGRE